ncbi:MAG TPA: hypothetical protein VHD90_14610 [Phototrophicaceae bacterium]|nr:hypothetical protein [Phototrophicaceae bacterium]
MATNRDAQSRREQIMNSGKELPGDAARAEDEEKNGSFDADDSGNFGTATAGHQAGDPLRREEINENEIELEGDSQRGDDDEAVDATGKALRNAETKPSASERSRPA